ncbi:MAG TPA: FAD-dependent oxidoreductase [Chloroflexota bacterium]|nr:FAD-dependent oxidoreductase [Chloroflexota bacterium]
MPAPEAESTDVLVIGGGVVGCAAAYHLAQRKVEVLLVERGDLNREASGANAGSLHIQIHAAHFRVQYLEHPRAAERADFFRASNRLFVEAARVWSQLETELQTDLGVRIGGGLMVAESAAELAVVEAKVRYEHTVGLPTRVVSTAEMLALAPALSPALLGASYCPNEGFANPLLVAPAFMRRARACGARLKLRTRVEGIEPGLRDRRFLVRTSAGPILARRIVVAAGAQTRQLCRLVGLDLPILTHPIMVMSTEKRPAVLSQLIQHAGTRPLTLRQTQYGTFVIGGGWPASEIPGQARFSVERQSIAANAAVAAEVLPALRAVRLTRAWAGMTTTVARKNRVGLLGEDRQRGDLYVVVASGLGFTLGPVLGRLMAEQVADGGTSLPMEPFGLEHAWPAA